MKVKRDRTRPSVASEVMKTYVRLPVRIRKSFFKLVQTLEMFHFARHVNILERFIFNTPICFGDVVSSYMVNSSLSI